MDWSDYFEAELKEHAAVLEATRDALREPFQQLVERSAAAVRGGGKILFFGNGGSAADAQHLAAELTVRYGRDRSPIAALALTTDSSTLTAAGNDLGFEQIFARQISALGCPGDVAIGISTSGRSPNIVNAVEVARASGLTAAAFTGGDGGKLVGLADPILIVPSRTPARIQEMHITLGQMLCGALEGELGLV